MKNTINTLFFAAAMLSPVFAFSQTTVQATPSENTQAKPDDAAKVKSSNQAKPDKDADQGRYNVSKRNKKIGKMKVEQCEIKEAEAGTSRGDAKAICGPKK